jgi:protocatechuate 3,4-dioxygenase beta subunit
MALLVACTPKNNADGQGESSSAMRNFPDSDCEDCNLMFVGMPKQITSIDTSDGWTTEGQKLIVNGTIYHADTKTPAANVILYYYHTDESGYYAPRKDMPVGAHRHGHLRGWVKTGADGTFSIYTSRPAQYPNQGAEAHIHIVIKEPDIDVPYWTDAWVFDDDPLLTPEMRNRMENRGGSGIMQTTQAEGVQMANQDIYLGLNIPGYPAR